MRYPFIPKSTKDLIPGQFWAVPLANRRFACGRVLQLGGQENPTPSRAFFGGLHRWVGTTPPTTDSTLGSDFVGFGIMHIRAITESGGSVLGERPLEADQIQMPTLLSAHGGPGTKLLLGASHVRDARKDEWGTLPVLGFWGKDFVVALANKQLAGKVA